MNGTLCRVLVATSLAVIVCSPQAKGVAPPMTSQSSHEFCVGRLSVELPAGAIVALRANYKAVDIEKPKTFRSFDTLKNELEARSKKLASVEMVRDSYGDRISRAGGLDPDAMYGKTQLLGLEIDDAQHQVLIGYHPKVDDSDILVEVHEFADGKDHIFQSKNIGANTYPRVRANLLTAAKQFKLINNRSMPDQPGFCADGGMFVDAGKPPVNERFTLVLTFPSHPDVQFSIDANAIDQVDKGEPSLKHRVNDDLKMMRANYSGGISVLERGELSAAGQKGYQIAISAPYDNVPGTHIRKFFWSADGVPNDVTRPFMEVDLTIQPTDDGNSTIKDDAEAKALWEALIGSLRIRPGAAQR